MTVYGAASHPGAPGTWQRDVWRALNNSAQVGAPNVRNRWRRRPPFTYRGDRNLRVTAATCVRKPYGRALGRNAYLTHLPRTVLFAWHEGNLVGRMVAWWCGSRTAYFRLIDEPDSPLCVPCRYRMQMAAESGLIDA